MIDLKSQKTRKSYWLIMHLLMANGNDLLLFECTEDIVQSAVSDVVDSPSGFGSVEQAYHYIVCNAIYSINLINL